MSKKEIVLSESMVQRIMELAGNKAFYNKNLITESTKKNKKVVSEANLPPTDDVEPESDLDTESPEGDLTSAPTPVESTPSVEDTALSDVGIEDSAPTMDTEMFLDELSDALMTHFGISLPVGTETGVETGVEEMDDEEPIVDDEDSFESDDMSVESEPTEDVTTPEPTKPPVTESKKLSPITQAIYEQLIKKLKTKAGKTMNESSKLKFTPKLNEAKNGQPKAPPHVNKTPKGSPGKPAKQSPKPTKKGC